MPAPVYAVVTVFNGGNILDRLKGHHVPLFIWGIDVDVAVFLQSKETGTIHMQCGIPDKKTARMIAMAGLRMARLQSGLKFEGDCNDVYTLGLLVEQGEPNGSRGIPD